VGSSWDHDPPYVSEVSHKNHQNPMSFCGGGGFGRLDHFAVANAAVLIGVKYLD
jgi:hypothetical protein